MRVTRDLLAEPHVLNFEGSELIDANAIVMEAGWVATVLLIDELHERTRVLDQVVVTNTQRLQNPLIEEYTLNHIRVPNMF